mmetsp:Transcript_15501/g.42845  ORF Transcript_15501/g.42845 Transcript_15501/m.42845 type:complete len:210 (-) Transcript_15501:105-734(-)
MPSSVSWSSSGLSPFSTFTGNGKISALKCPASVAARARRWLSSAKRSSSSFVMPYFLARSSAPPNWLKLRASMPNSSKRFIDSPYRARSPGPLGSPCPLLKPSMTLAPIGTCVMLSTPAAMTQSCVPLITAWHAKWIACCPEPHCRSTATPGTRSGKRLELKTVVRPRLLPCAPTWLTHPTMTSSTPSPATPALSSNPSTTAAHKSAGW